MNNNDGCVYCGGDSWECCIGQDSDTNEWVLFVETSQWDSYGDDWFYERLKINYCPWCGRKLGE